MGKYNIWYIYKEKNTFSPPYKHTKGEVLILDTYEEEPELVDNKEIIFNDSITYITAIAFRNTNIIGDLKLPKNLKRIGASAFRNCRGLSKLTLNNKIKIIGPGAFRNCINLKGNLVFPESLEEIQLESFKKCRGLTGDLNINRNIKHMGESVFEGCSGLNGTVKISNTVITSSSVGAFKDCTGIEKVIFEEGLTYVASYMFEGCVSLSSCILPDSISFIKDKAFNGCTSLTGSFTIPSNIKDIGDYAFAGCNISKFYISKESTEIKNKHWNAGCDAEIIYY